MAEWWHKRRVYFRFISRILALRAEAQPRENPIMTMMTADGGTRKKVLRWHTVATPEKGARAVSVSNAANLQPRGIRDGAANQSCSTILL